MSLDFADVQAEMRRLSVLIDKGIEALTAQSRELAEAEAEYRKAKALAYVQITEGTAAAREAAVNGAVADLRYKRDLADGMAKAALEAVRSRRTQVSALQTLVNASTEESKFARTGPS